MKQLTIAVTWLGKRVITTAVISDDVHGGSAVPSFGTDALRLGLLALEEVSTATLEGKLEHVQMMNEGRTFDELKAAHAAKGRQ